MMMHNFKTEVSQNRPRMALQELVPILEEMQARIDALEARLSTPEVKAVEAAPSPSLEESPIPDLPAKKVPVKKAPAKKTTQSKKMVATQE